MSTKTAPSRTTESVFYDLSRPRPPHTNPAQQALAGLQEDDEYEHDHRSYRTSFAVWLAQQRQRIGRSFAYRPHPSKKGLYLISLAEEAVAA